MSEDFNVLVDAAGDPGEKGERSINGKCPKCGAPIDGGFGFAYGGYGPYEWCSKECGWYWKRVLRDDEE